MINIRSLIFLFSMSFSSLIYAEKTSDLLSLYNEALRHDALLSAATIQNKATQELIDQGLSLLLPNISAQGSYTDLDNSRKFNTPISNVLLAGTKADYQNYEYGVVVRQPIFNYASYNRYKQNLIQTSLSDKQLLWSRQDLIYRVVKLYFETLQASDEIDLLQAQRKEILAQLAEAEAMFNAGLVSITDVNETKTKAASLWNKELGRIEVGGGTVEQYKTFYTALYRVLLFPRKFYELNAANEIVHYSPYNGKVLPGYMFTDNGFWDTFRAVFPFFTIMYPDYLSQVMQGLVNTYKESGWLPEWASPGHRDCMVGSNSAVNIADAYLRGIRGYDINLSLIHI